MKLRELLAAVPSISFDAKHPALNADVGKIQILIVLRSQSQISNLKSQISNGMIIPWHLLSLGKI